MSKPVSGSFETDGSAILSRVASDNLSSFHRAARADRYARTDAEIEAQYAAIMKDKRRREARDRRNAKRRADYAARKRGG